MALRKPLATVVAALVATLGTVAPVAAASVRIANTASEPHNTITYQTEALATCPEGKLCVWTEPYFTGLKAEFRATSSGSCKWAWLAYRSAYNRTGVAQRLYTNSNCTGSREIILNDEALANLGARHSVGGYP